MRPETEPGLTSPWQARKTIARTRQAGSSAHDKVGALAQGLTAPTRESETMSETMSKDIAARTIDMIASRSEFDAEKITLNTERAEIGVNSLELTEIVMDLEDLFDIQIDLNAAEAWDSLKNVGDIVDAIDKLVSARR